MPNAINESSAVVNFFAEQAREVTLDFYLVFPIANVLLQVFHHVGHLDVGTTMLGTLQRTDARGDGRISIRTR